MSPSRRSSPARTSSSSEGRSSALGASSPNGRLAAARAVPRSTLQAGRMMSGPREMGASTRIGTEIAGFRIESVLGRGGMSVVYVAEQVRLARKVALKVLTTELSWDEQFRERFVRESHIAATID